MIAKLKMVGERMKKKMKNGDKFIEIYEKQVEFQKIIIDKFQSHISDGNIPADNPTLFQYHMTGIVEELGELLKADKRWKTHRNDTFDKENKIEELSDCFIILMNIAIHSGYEAADILSVIENKISSNLVRFKKL